MSKQSREAAQERLRRALFGDGLTAPIVAQPSERDRLFQQARELRELATRGMKPRAYIAKARALETQATALGHTKELR